MERLSHEQSHGTLVTGGAKNLGAEICRTLAVQGHALAIHYHTSQSQAEAVAAQCRTLGVQAETIQGDFTTRRSTEQFLESFLSRLARQKP